MVSFQEWQRMELKVAKILSVEEVEGKDKLYKIQIDLGQEKRQIVAGLRQFYSKEQLHGNNIIVVANLHPAKIAGIESQAMLLAAKNREGRYKVVTTKSQSNAGERVVGIE